MADLGPLKGLLGKWSGKGLNVIWRPMNAGGSDRFLEINLTHEDIEFIEIPDLIPNRGFLQGDIGMRGLRYLQQVKDANTGGGLHIEPGVWAFVPATTSPREVETVVRMGSVPHGTTLLAQGVASTKAGAPTFARASIAPISLAFPNQPLAFVETNLGKETAFRSPASQIAGVSQAMLDDPNSVLAGALAGRTIRSTTVIDVSTAPTPVIGGGTANTAFLVGGTAGPNAQATLVSATFWIETIAGEHGAPDTVQLQYSQTVMLDFAGLHWPHVSVATLARA